MLKDKIGLKDKRVDKMLFARNLVDTDIYYSPIVAWLFFLVVVLAIAHGLVFQLAFSKYFPLLLLYILGGYTVCAFLNNSFALTQDALIVINPNFPFRQVKTYPLSDIRKITIDKSKWKWHFAFCIFGSNYIAIQTADDTKKYFCVGLELDAYDENLTEKTMDSFQDNLKGKGIQTVFKLDKH